MKKLVVAMLLVVGLLFSAGCGAKHYTIYMNSGDELVAVGKPKYDEATNSVTYETVDGQKIAIRKDDVEKIVEHLK